MLQKARPALQALASSFRKRGWRCLRRRGSTLTTSMLLLSTWPHWMSVLKLKLLPLCPEWSTSQHLCSKSKEIQQSHLRVLLVPSVVPETGSHAKVRTATTETLSEVWRIWVRVHHGKLPLCPCAGVYWQTRPLSPQHRGSLTHEAAFQDRTSITGPSGLGTGSALCRGEGAAGPATGGCCGFLPQFAEGRLEDKENAMPISKASLGHSHVVDIHDLDELLALNGPDLAAGDKSSSLDAREDHWQM